MSFLQPAMLAGLLGALVPILIHLIHKRRPRRQPFAAIEFVLRSVERVERRWRLKRFLLLAARVALVAAFCLAAARPLFGPSAAAAPIARGPQRVAIVVDASLSMRARYNQGESAFERARAMARDRVKSLGPEDRATIVASELEPRVMIARPTASKSDLLAAIDQLAPTFAHADLAEAVTEAARALSSAPRREGEPPQPPAEARVVVLSDLAGHSIKAAAEIDVDGTPAALELIDVTGVRKAEERVNRGLTSIEVAHVPGSAPRTIEARVKVRSFMQEHVGGKDAVAADIDLRSGDRELQAGSVDIPPGGVVEKALTVSFPDPGSFPITVALEPDSLAEDDLRHAVADVRRSVRVLIVDGAPSGLPKQDEVFYLEAALAAGAQDQPPPRVITSDDLSREDLEGVYDVIVLAGVSSFLPADGPRLVSFVERGGGLWITAAEGVDVDVYNGELGTILPRKLRGIRILDGEGMVGATGSVQLAQPQLEHPVLAVFAAGALPGLLSTETRGYLVLEPDRGKPADVLLAFEDGQPALVLGDRGKGRVALLTTSIDRELTDLPIRPGFLPLVRRLLLHLGNALSPPSKPEVLVGQPRPIPIPSGAIAIEVTAPGDHRTRFASSDLKGKTEINFTATQVPGHYAVRIELAAGAESLAGEDFAVNVDPRESDLRPVSVEEATAVLTGRALPGNSVARASALAAVHLGDPEAIAAALLILMMLSFWLESALTAQRPGS